MNEVKRYAIISDDWDYVESPSGGFVDHDDYAALEAEREMLRVKLMTIASAEPARHGIEWAKAHAAEGNNEVYAKWREAIDAALSAQQSSHVSVPRELVSKLVRTYERSVIDEAHWTDMDGEVNQLRALLNGGEA